MHHKDVNTLVAQHLSIHDLTSFVRTCSLFNKCGQPFLDTEAFQRLLSCAKYGKKQEAKALLHKVSIASIRLLEILLTRRVTFKDAGEYRTYVNRTIGQFVLSSNNEDFWEMLQPYYKLIPNGETIMLSQIAEQFPGPPQKLVNHYDFGSLVFAFNEMNSGLEENVSAAINLALPNEHPFMIDLNKFRHEIEYSQKTEITIGRSTNIAAIFEVALDVYIQHVDSWRETTKSLFSNQVFGFLIRFFNICDAQRLQQGLLSLAIGEQFKRSLFVNENTDPLFPLDANPNDRLGFHFSLDCYYGAKTRLGVGGHNAPEAIVLQCRQLLGNLVSNNNFFLTALTQPETRPSKSSMCVVC